jgi:hypothetical protein
MKTKILFLLGIAVFLTCACGTLPVKEMEDYYAHYAKAVTNPQASPYYKYNRQQILDAFDKRVVELRQKNGKLYTRGMNLLDDCKNDPVEIMQIGILYEVLLNKLSSNLKIEANLPNTFGSFSTLNKIYIYVTFSGLTETFANEYHKKADEVMSTLDYHFDMHTNPLNDQRILGDSFVAENKILENKILPETKEKLIGNFKTERQKSQTVILLSALDYLLSAIDSDISLDKVSKEITATKKTIGIARDNENEAIKKINEVAKKSGHAI